MTKEKEKNCISRNELDKFAERKFPHLSDDELVRFAIAYELKLN